MSTNEELALKIKQGDTGLYSQLWEQTYKLLYKQAVAFWRVNTELLQRCGLMLDDLKQIAYFALVTAVKAFDPSSGFKLTSYFRYSMQNEIKAAIDGGRKRNARDPLNGCTSLNMPLDEEEGSAELLDVVPDREAGLPFDEAEDREYNVALYKVLWSCVEDLPGRQRDVIVGKYREGLSYKQISEKYGVSGSYIHNLDVLGKANLRRAARLLRYLEDETDYYKGSSFTAFKIFGRSSVERLAEWRERERERLKKVPHFRTDADITEPRTSPPSSTP